jgi:hypothetical protein
MRLQAPWIDNLSDGLLIKDIEATRRVVAALRKNLDVNDREA